MSKEYEPGNIHKLKLEIPGATFVTIESVNASAAVTWPTELGANETLQILRRSMKIGSDVVKIYAISKDYPSLRLGGMKSLSSSAIEELLTTEIIDRSTDSRIVWQRSLDEHSGFQAGVSSSNLELDKLRNALDKTGVPALKPMIDLLIQTVSEEMSKKVS